MSRKQGPRFAGMRPPAIGAGRRRGNVGSTAGLKEAAA